MSMTSTRADDMTIVFFLPPSWRNPESHVLKLPAVWFLVAEDVIRAHTNWLPSLCCSLPSLFLLFLFFALCHCFFFPLLPTSGPVLPWQDIPLVPVRVPFRDPGLGGIKIKKKTKKKQCTFLLDTFSKILQNAICQAVQHSLLAAPSSAN